MQSQYRIAMVGACPYPTAQGSQVLIEQLSEELAQRGHIVHIVTYHLGDPARPSSLNTQLHRIPKVPGYHKIGSGPAWGKLVLDALLLFQLAHVVRHEGIDVIHAHNYEALLVSWLVGRITDRPVIYHSHNVMAAELPSYFRRDWARRAARRLGYLLDDQLPRRADICIAMSMEAVSFFRRSGVPADRIRLIPPGIRDTAPAQVDPASIRSQHNLGSGPLVIYTGNLDQYQRLDLLFHSFRQVRAVWPTAQLVIATHSRPPQYRHIVDQASENAGIVFIHCTSFAEVQSLLIASDVAVCPRVACFGFPIKLLNYMAAGKAVVVARGSARGIRHLENGYVVRDGSAALAAGVLHLLRDSALAQRLGQAARNTVATHFRWETAASEIERCYDLAAGRYAEPYVTDRWPTSTGSDPSHFQLNPANKASVLLKNNDL